MKRERAKELLPIIQAFAEGKDIQFQTVEGFEWRELVNFFGTMFDDYKYRIKPEPREYWVIDFNAMHQRIFISKEQAKKELTSYGMETLFKVREVIE